MKINIIIDSFLLEKSIILRAETYRYLREQTKQISIFLDSIKVYDFNKLKYNHLLNFIQYQKEKKLSNVTINKRIMILKRLIRFAYEHKQKNTIELYKIIQFKKLNEHYNSYRTLNDFELKKLLDYQRKLNTKDFYIFRLKIIILLLLSTGVRATELINIKVSNIDFINRTIYLEHTKTEKPRFVYISKYLVDLLKKYVVLFNLNSYLITSYDRTTISIDNLTTIFGRLSKKLGFNVSPHVIRHTYATKLLENGINIESLRKILGHTKLTTTQIYLSLNDKFTKNQFDKGDILKNGLLHF